MSETRKPLLQDFSLLIIKQHKENRCMQSRKPFRPHRSRRGLTLIEVLLVIVILALLAGVSVFALRGVLSGANEDTTRLKLKDIDTQITRYHLDMKAYPEELNNLVEKPETDTDETNTNAKWNGPYVKGDLKDAWGNDIQYELVESSGEENATPYKLFSMGKDGQAETEDDITITQKTESNQ